MTKKIQLSQGEHALVDDEDFEYLNQWNWFVNKMMNPLKYAIRHEYQGMVDGKPKKTKIIMHRIIMNAPDDKQVDHVNGDGLDNRKCNLRIVTNRQNSQNRHITKTSKYPGVSWDKSRNKWMACIKIKGKTKTLGRFKSEKKAYLIYKNAVHDLTGEKLISEIK